MTRIVIIHNFLWSHYKSALFGELHRQSASHNSSVHVVQIARTERSRLSMSYELKADYPYTLLFDDCIENISTRRRIQAVIKRVRALKPSVIMLTGYYDPAQVLVLVWAKLNGIRVVLQNESTQADQQRGGWKELLKHRIIDRCDGFFCFGSRAVSYILQLGAPVAKILIRQNAVVDNRAIRKVYDSARSQRRASQTTWMTQPNNFIYVGRLAPEKNLSYLVAAFSRATSQTPTDDWGLLLLGDGPAKERLQQQIEQLGLNDRVKLLPGQPWFRVPEFLAMADVFVLPSLSEPWGLVVNEAMVCSLPVLVSDRCGCAPDLVQAGENGYCFDPESSTALETYLSQFMRNQVDRQRMGERSAEIIAPFSPEVVAPAMLTAFVRLASS